MSTTIQVRVDNELKSAADDLFTAMGFDTSTAIRMFLHAALRENAIPFRVEYKPNAETLQAMEDVRLNRNLYGPFKTAALELPACFAYRHSRRFQMVVVSLVLIAYT